MNIRDFISLDNLDYRQKYTPKTEKADDTEYIDLYKKSDGQYWGTLIRKLGKIINPHSN